MGLEVKDDGRRIPDALSERTEWLLPPQSLPPLSRHNPRVSDGAPRHHATLVLVD